MALAPLEVCPSLWWSKCQSLHLAADMLALPAYMPLAVSKKGQCGDLLCTWPALRCKGTSHARLELAAVEYGCVLLDYHAVSVVLRKSATLW